MYTRPNTVTHRDGFYISYNPYEPWYGGDTTAVVLGNMDRFYILMGNHRKSLEGLSFTECINYIHDNMDMVNMEYSDPVPPRDSTIESALSYHSGLYNISPL